jgi:hypothetical protein
LSSTYSKGFVAVFEVPLAKEIISACVISWLERFEKVEQTVPSSRHDVATLCVTKVEEVIWEENMQFRVVHGSEFSWVYVTVNGNVMETTGQPSEEISLCLDVLLELPGVIEVVDENNNKRLEELEKKRLL